MEFGGKEKKQLGIVGVLVVVLAGAMINGAITLKKGPKSKNKPSGAKQEETNEAEGRRPARPAAPEAVVGDKNLYQNLEDDVKDLVLARDPFALSLSRGGLRLSGIIWSEDNPQAIINDIMVKAGDSIDKNKVVRILEDKVILSDGNGDFELKIE